MREVLGAKFRLFSRKLKSMTSTVAFVEMFSILHPGARETGRVAVSIHG